jgi:hypothetical protein
MKGFLFVLAAGLAKAITKLLYLRKPAHRNVVDPKTVARVRLTPEGSGWIYEDGWPKRCRKKLEDH